MTRDTETPPPARPIPRSHGDDKAERLAAALRENLRRRKDQARRRAAETGPGSAGDDETA